MKDHEYYMQLAIEFAWDAGIDNEAPVGCVIVDAGGNVVGCGRNRREKSKKATAHAEINAIEDACKNIGDWRLDGCTLYSTLEPCPMCAGAIIMSRISKLYFGANDDLTGACGSVYNIFMEPFGQTTQVTGGILSGECGNMLTEFFEKLRRNG